VNCLASAGMLIASGLVGILPRALYWLLVILPGAPYLFLSAAYGRILKYKRLKMESLIDRPGVLGTYVINFGKVGDKKEDLVDELFALHYNWGAYGLVIILNMLVIAAAVAIAFVQGGIPLGLPAELKSYVLRARRSIAGTPAGAHSLHNRGLLIKASTQSLKCLLASSGGGGISSGDTSGTGSIKSRPRLWSAHLHSFSTQLDRLAPSDQKR
jgi:hypothetical protein